MWKAAKPAYLHQKRPLEIRKIIYETKDHTSGPEFRTEAEARQHFEKELAGFQNITELKLRTLNDIKNERQREDERFAVQRDLDTIKEAMDLLGLTDADMKKLRGEDD